MVLEKLIEKCRACAQSDEMIFTDFERMRAADEYQFRVGFGFELTIDTVSVLALKRYETWGSYPTRSMSLLEGEGMVDMVDRITG